MYAHTGQLNFSDVRISAATGTREARAELPNRTACCARASSCAWCCAARRGPNAVTVPQRAVMEGPQGKFVYVVDEKSTARAAAGRGRRLDAATTGSSPRASRAASG